MRSTREKRPCPTTPTMEFSSSARLSTLGLVLPIPLPRISAAFTSRFHRWIAFFPLRTRGGGFGQAGPLKPSRNGASITRLPFWVTKYGSLPSWCSWLSGSNRIVGSLDPRSRSRPTTYEAAGGYTSMGMPRL